jgi:hypothetical protein
LVAGDEEGEGSEDSEEDSGQNNPEGSDEEDTEHEQLLARIAAAGSKHKKRTVVLHEGIMEGEHSVAVAGHSMHADDPEGVLGLNELLQATQVSQADSKALQKLATGKKVRPTDIGRCHCTLSTSVTLWNRSTSAITVCLLDQTSPLWGVQHAPSRFFGPPISIEGCMNTAESYFLESCCFQSSSEAFYCRVGPPF